MRPHAFISALALLGSLLTQPPAHATTRDELVAFVREARDFVKTHSKQEALEEFSKRNGRFVRGELYIFAYDFEGLCLAHGGRPVLVGKNLLKLADRAGNYPIKDNIQGLRKDGGRFFHEFLWDNPTDNTYDRKLGYVEKVDDTWWLGSGIYLGPAASKDLKR